MSNRRIDRAHFWPVPSIVFSLVFFFTPFNAHAYLDPGAGSMIAQCLLAGMAGLLVMAQLLWRRWLVKLKARLLSRKSSNSQE